MTSPRIALLQSSGRPGDVAHDLRVLRDAARAGARTGARLPVCQEMFLTGYAIGGEVRRLAEPADGEGARAVAGVAAESGVAALCGYPERARTDDGVNRTGPEGEFDVVGLSCPAGPDGTVKARAGRGRESVSATVDAALFARSRELNPYLRDRRPGLYGALV